MNLKLFFETFDEKNSPLNYRYLKIPKSSEKFNKKYESSDFVEKKCVVLNFGPAILMLTVFCELMDEERLHGTRKSKIFQIMLGKSTQKSKYLNFNENLKSSSLHCEFRI